MRKLTAILLLFSFIFGDTVHVNVLRIHVMAEHYQMHRQNDGDLGFAAFLKMHYLDEHGYSMIHQVHSNLPFKNGQHTGSFNLLCYDIPFIPQTFTLTEYTLFVNVPVEVPSLLYSGFPDSQFHPPSFS